MKTTASLLVLAAGVAASAASLAQEVAGRLIVSVGDVSIQRGAERIPAQFGTQLRAGDTLQLGGQSNAQVLMTDQSVIALRPDTNFKIEEYAFAGKRAEEQRSLFSLLKGGMRTVTGLIGRVNHKNYAVNTPTATVGIRGTNYTLVQCDGNCRNADGALAPNGTYGAVTDGRIGVTNQSGEHQFGADQYFHVASSTSAPTQLIAPPGFLRDTLEGRARARERGQQQQQAQARAQGQQGSSSGGSSESAATVASTDDSRISSTVTTYTPPAALSPIVTVPTTTSSTVTNLVAPALSTVFYHLDSLGGPLNIPATCSPQPCTSSTVVGGSLTLGVNLVLQRAYVKADFLLANGSRFNTGTPFDSGGIPISINGGQITFAGTFDRADFPNGQGGFRCSTCGAGDTLGFLSSISVSGTINGPQANLTFAGASANGGGTFSATLTQQTPPNNLAAVAVLPVFNVNNPTQQVSTTSTSDAYWGVGVNSAGALTQIGVVGSGGVNIASVGSATIVTPANATFTLPDGSKIIGGAWIGSGASGIDPNYINFTTGSSSEIPWIVGSLTNTLPASLGTVTYTPVLSAVNLTSTGLQNGTLNSASLTADFVNRNVSVSLNATNNLNSNRFQMNGSSGVSATSARFGAGFTSVTCSNGPCTGGGTLGGNFAGFFAGPNAEGAGVAFSAGFGSGTGVSGVVGFKR